MYIMCIYKRKHELSKNSRKKTNFINRLNYAEHKILRICIDVYKVYEANGFNKIREVLSKKKKKEIEK